jgi:hypothetical protein
MHIQEARTSSLHREASGEAPGQYRALAALEATSDWRTTWHIGGARSL